MAYPEPGNPLDLLAICAASRPPCETYMHYRRYAVEDVPCSDMESLRDWVYARWCEKEELLNEYYETKKFPLIPKSQQINKENISSIETLQEAKLVTVPETKNKSTESLQEAQFVSMTEINKKSTASTESLHEAQFVATSKIKKESTDSTKSIRKAHKVTMSEWWIVFLHFFFISSSVFHCYLLSKMWNFVHT